jgi:uncharacterized protein (DUF58 family)
MVIGPPLFISLGFLLTVIAAESLALLAFARLTSASISPTRMRTFKHERAEATLRIGSVRSKLVGSRRFVLVTPYGLECAMGEFREGSSALTLEPSKAGRFEDLSLKMVDGDILGLFTRETTVQLDEFVLESLPSSFRVPLRQILVSPISLGDVPAGRRGGGQEMLAVEEYHQGLDAKDLIWRRVAQSPTEELVSRSRESSVRRSVSLGIALEWKTEESRAILFDLAAEALAQVSKALLGLGIAVRISFVSQGRISSTESSNLAELADSILAMTGGDSCVIVPEAISASDIVLVEKESFFQESQSPWASRTDPILLISSSPANRVTGDKLFVFTGTEDLTNLVESVIET